MDNREMEMKELNLEDLDKVSGGSRTPGSEDLQQLLEAEKDFQRRVQEADEAKRLRMQRRRELEKMQEDELHSHFF